MSLLLGVYSANFVDAWATSTWSAEGCAGKATNATFFLCENRQIKM
jgi:hypothetical protein